MIKRAKEIEEAYKIYENTQIPTKQQAFELGLYLGLQISKKIMIQIKKEIQKKKKKND